MQSSKLSVGDAIEARCTKCRQNNEHVIVTFDDDGPVKVQCNICSRQHKFRSPSVAKKAAVRPATRAKSTDCKEWELRRPNMDSAKALDYSMTAAYKVNALISHPSFGLGLVQRVVGAQKIEILFENGLKTMRCK
ncbi:MAG TPA: hypothetical protein VIR78_02300 [Malonomonas sp.]